MSEQTQDPKTQGTRTPTPVVFNARKSHKAFYRTFLNIVSAVAEIKLSEQEIDIMDECFNLGGKFDTDTRKDVVTNLKVSPSNLNNYIKKLKDKGYLDDSMRLIEKLRPVNFMDDGGNVKIDDIIQIKINLIRKELVTKK